MFFQIIFLLWIIYISRKLYTDGDYDDLTFDKEDKVKIPIILYILFVVISFIPIMGLFIHIFTFYRISKEIINEDLYYKPGKITQFLFKEV